MSAVLLRCPSGKTTSKIKVTQGSACNVALRRQDSDFFSQHCRTSVLGLLVVPQRLLRSLRADAWRTAEKHIRSASSRCWHAHGGNRHMDSCTDVLLLASVAAHYCGFFCFCRLCEACFFVFASKSSCMLGCASHLCPTALVPLRKGCDGNGLNNAGRGLAQCCTVVAGVVVKVDALVCVATARTTTHHHQ